MSPPEEQINVIVASISQRLTQREMEVANSHSQTLSQILRNDHRDWWQDALTIHKAELLEKIRELLSATENGQDSCLEGAARSPRRITWKGKRLYAYQLICIASQGVIPRQDEVVRHKCHNRRCINPNHLELGTQQDNIQDEGDRQEQ